MLSWYHIHCHCWETRTHGNIRRTYKEFANYCPQVIISQLFVVDFAEKRAFQTRREKRLVVPTVPERVRSRLAEFVSRRCPEYSGVRRSYVLVDSRSGLGSDVSGETNSLRLEFVSFRSREKLAVVNVKGFSVCNADAILERLSRVGAEMVWEEVRESRGRHRPSREMLCDVAMDANGNGKRDPLHGGPVYFHRRAASNDVSRTTVLEKHSENFVNVKATVNQISDRATVLTYRLHPRTLAERLSW